MSVETVEKPLAEVLLERAQERFPLEGVSLLQRAIAFAQSYYAEKVHPTAIPYTKYVFHVAKFLVELEANAVVVSAAVLCPPQPITQEIADGLQKEFANEREVLELIHEVDIISAFEWDSWSKYPPKGGGKERQELLRKMFLLAIGEANREEQSQDLLAMIHFQSEEKQAENIIRMLFAAVPDIRALIIKLADRLCLMKFLKDLPPGQKEAFRYEKLAKITLTIYTSIAHRLGIWSLKSELEDMSFRLLQPAKYKEIADLLSQKKRDRKNFIDHTIIPAIRSELEAYGIRAEVSGRPKHIYSIYQKMEEKHVHFQDINDLLAIRIIVETEQECYEALDVLFLHHFWPRVFNVYGGKTGRDWIAHPKPNGYRSLHTTIFVEGKEVEVQIRTHEMNEIAEYGISALHWRYKESKTYRKNRSPRDLGAKDRKWNERLIEVRRNLRLEEPPMTEPKSLLKDWIFVLTPKGHVIGLQEGSTPVDFAYRIHSEVGNRYISAKVNGRPVNKSHKLKNGDCIEIVMSRIDKGPNPEWLSQNIDKNGGPIVRTNQARSKIRHWLRLYGSHG